MVVRILGLIVRLSVGSSGMVYTYICMLNIRDKL